MAKTMIPMDGLKGVNEYLDTRHHLNFDVDQNINDFGRVVFAAGYDVSMREVLCNLLAGKGLLLPNIQICLSVNLKAILGVEGLQTKLRSALSKLDTAVDKFIKNTGIESILGRLDSALAEMTQIANMINFCGKPLVPISITNTLENAMQSFLGKGKKIINDIGEMIPDKVGGCLSFDGQEFNKTLFTGGILGDISKNWDRVRNGQLTQSELDLIEERVTSVVAEVEDLIVSENNTDSVVEFGGSDFGDTTAPLNTELGVLHNPEDAGIQGNARIASQLQSLYSRLAGYQVIDDNGKVYENVFKLFLDDNMIGLLRRPQNPEPTVSTQEPIFNYCGDIIGYTTNITQQEQVISSGLPPVATPTVPPGFKANGLPTSTESVFIEPTVVSLDTSYSETVITNTNVPTQVLFSQDITILKNESWLYTVTAIARFKSTGQTTVIKKSGVVFDFNDTPTMSNDSVTVERIGSNIGTNWDVTVQLNGSNIEIFVTGQDNADIQWKVKFEVEKV